MITVEQLIKKLSKMPKDSKVILRNVDSHANGVYDLDAVEDWREGVVCLHSDYKKNYLTEGGLYN